MQSYQFSNQCVLLILYDFSLNANKTDALYFLREALKLMLHVLI